MSKHNLSGAGGAAHAETPQQSRHRDLPPPSSGSKGKGSSHRLSPLPFRKDHWQGHDALEAERLRFQEAQRCFAVELRELREGAKIDQQLLADKLRSKAERQLAHRLQQLREENTRQREAEIRLLLRWKEAELREAQEFLKQERDAAMQQARDLQRQLAKELVSRGSSRATLEEVLGKLRWEVDGDQASRIRHLEAELELERRLFLQYILERFEGEPLPAESLQRIRQAFLPRVGKVNSWGAAGKHPQEGMPQPGGLPGDSCNQLKKQNRDLLNSLKILEGRCSHLEEENTQLRKSGVPDMQDRVKTLKREGDKLAVIGKRLEEAAKKLQESNLRVSNTPGPPLVLNCSDRGLCERVFAPLEAKDLNEEASVLMAKDRQVEALQKECQELPAKLSFRKENHSSGIMQNTSSTTHEGLEDSSLAKKKPETLTILKKDGEPQILTFSNWAKNNQNSVLKSESESDPHLQRLEKQLVEKERQCENLMCEVGAKEKICHQLGLEVHKLLMENAKLSEENSQLRGKKKGGEKMAHEDADLSVKVTEASNEQNSAVQLTQRLEVTAENLEEVLKNMKERAERQRPFEPEKTELELQKTEEIQQAPTEITRGHDEEVQFLETQVRELDCLYPSQMEHVNLLNPDGATGELEEWETHKVSRQLPSDNARSFRLRCFLARYSYDPFNGPNKDPEAELPLTAGEYVYIYGEMDEDGFYMGELTDGRRGFVPSNLVEEVAVYDHNVCCQDIFPEKDQGKQIKQLCKELSKLSVSPLETQEDKTFRSSQVSVGDFGHHFDLSDIEEKEEEDKESQLCVSGEDACKPREKPKSPLELAKAKILMTTLSADQKLNTTHSISNSGPLQNVTSGASVTSGTSRLSVALSDYDPTVMSPNSDVDEVELPFQERLIQKVTSDRDADRGECEGKKGFIPCNVDSEIHMDRMEDVTSHLE